jgi:hypothetical protein
MIGLILIVICLSIVFLTAPNARKKIRKMYNDLIPEVKVAVGLNKQRYSRLFKFKKEVNNIDSPEEVAMNKLFILESTFVDSDVSFSASFQVDVNELVTGSNLIREEESNQDLSDNAIEKTGNAIVPNINIQISDHAIKEALTLLMAALITDISRRLDFLHLEPDEFIQVKGNLEEEAHPVLEEEYANTHFGDLDSMSNASINQDDLPDTLAQYKNIMIPADIALVGPEDINGFISSSVEHQDTINNYEDGMKAYEITLMDKDLAVGNPDGVIDIDQDDEIIDTEDLSLGISVNIPSWPHRYIYAVSDLDHASQEQKDFYKKFKHAFYQERYIDTLGNSNYYFILLFDIFEDYKKHRDLMVLENLVDNISLEYPRTRSYARKFLLEKMYEANNSEGIERLESRIITQNSFMSWDWQSRFRDKLNLTKSDQKIIEKIYLPTNNFVENSFCATELVKLYIRTIKVLNKAYVSKGLQKDDEFGIVLDLIARKEYRFHLNSTNYNYQVKNGSSTIYGYLLKYCEQLLRSFYYFKKLSSFDKQYTHAAVNEAIKEHILAHIELSLPELMGEVLPLDLSTERLLYTLHPTRWKFMLRLDEASYLEKGNEEFIKYAETVIALNKGNTSLENIFLDLSKFLAGLDKQKSLEYFLKYIDQNISARKLVLKEMPKTMSRKLFKDSESHIRYIKTSISLMKRELTIGEALLEVKGFYEPIRRKIQLDQKVIKRVQEDFTGTVDLLGEFLSDDDSKQIEEISVAPAEDATLSGVSVESSSKYSIELTQIESGLLDLFKSSAFSLRPPQIADYCHLTGCIQNVLINNINEKCYDVIDDLLIEDHAESFTIDANYFAQIQQL